MDRRVELAPEQRVVEPKNADSHLAFIAAGLRTCVTYANRPDEPVCFVNLDGVNAGKPRRRHTRVIGFHREESWRVTRSRCPSRPTRWTRST